MRFAPLALALVCVLVLFTGLPALGLIDVREARDAEVAKELIAGAEVLTPLYAHEPLHEKPILGYAPEVAARLLARDFDVRSRQIRALAALLLVVLTASIGAQHFGARAAWLSGLVLATTFALPLAARTDGTQMWATLLGWLGCAAFADALFGRSAGRSTRLTVGYVALATVLVAAGPLPAVWPFVAVAVYLKLARDGRGWRMLQPLAGAALMAGLALPWYGAMIERHGVDFLTHAWTFPYGAGERRAWYAGLTFSVSFLVLGSFPWCALLPLAFQHARIAWFTPRGAVPRRPRLPADPDLSDPLARQRHEESAAHFFIACLLAALVPIVFYPGAPIPSVLPAMPAVALLCGRLLDHLLEDRRRLAGPLLRALIMLALLGSALAAPAAAIAPRLGDAASDLRLVATAVFVTSWLPLLAALLRRPRIAAALVLLPVAVGTPLVAWRLLPGLDSFLGTRPVAEAMNTASPPLAALVTVEAPPPSLRLYLQRNLVVADTLATTLERHRASDHLAYIAFRPSREAEVLRAVDGPIEILLRTAALVLARVHP
jgi:4-amino-4-deoxy-L-arabinose transferase-like glycosyltransferase